MNEHFNKNTREYRYKKYTKISKEFIKIHMFIHKMGDNYYIPENGIEYHYAKFDYKPYWFYRFIWFLKKLKIQSPKLTISNIIAIASMIIVVILYLLDRLYFEIL